MISCCNHLCRINALHNLPGGPTMPKNVTRIIRVRWMQSLCDLYASLLIKRSKNTFYSGSYLTPKLQLRPLKTIGISLSNLSLDSAYIFPQFSKLKRSRFQGSQRLIAVFFAKVENDTITCVYVGDSTCLLNLNSCLR